MSMGVSVKKEKIAEYLGCFRNQTPIPIPQTVEELFTLMGTSLAVLLAHTNALCQLTGRAELPTHPEHLEAVTTQMRREIQAANEVICRMAAQVLDGTYDKHYEPNFTAEISVAETGQTAITPISGLKPKQGELN